MKSTLRKLIPLFGLLLLLACTNSTTSNQGMALLEAIDNGDSSKVEQLLTDEIDPDVYPLPPGQLLSGAFPLHLAVAKGEPEIVKTLLTHGAKIDLKAGNQDEATPLHWAVFFLQKEIVSILLAEGAPVNSLDAHGGTPVDTAYYIRKVNKDEIIQSVIIEDILLLLLFNGGLAAEDLHDG